MSVDSYQYSVNSLDKDIDGKLAMNTASMTPAEIAVELAALQEEYDSVM